MPKTYPKTCLICSAEYISLRSRGKYCSIKCGRKAYNDQFRARHQVSRVAIWRQKLRAKGLCICGATPIAGKALCLKCRTETNARKRRTHKWRPQRLTEEVLARGRERKREWYQKNKEYVIKTAARWAKQNPTKISIKSARHRARKMGAEGSHTIGEWQEILKQHNHRCVHCGTDKRITKDHITPLSKGGSNYASNLQPLCKSCNSRKRDRVTA